MGYCEQQIIHASTEYKSWDIINIQERLLLLSCLVMLSFLAYYSYGIVIDSL